VRTKLTGAPLEPADELNVVDELAQHLEDRFHQLVSGGLSEAEALAECERELDVDDFIGELTRGLKDQA
jgi:hypothetical protein